MLFALVLALCVCGCVQGAAIQEQKPFVPMYKLVGNAGSMEVRQYDPMILVSMDNTGVNHVLDNIQTELVGKQINDSTVSLNSAQEGNCYFPFYYNFKWYYQCGRSMLHGLRYFCLVGDRRKACTEADKKVTMLDTFNNIVPKLRRKGFSEYVIEMLRRMIVIQQGQQVIGLSASDPEQVVISYVIHPNHATQASNLQDASLIQYPSTTVLVKKLEGEGEGTEPGYNAGQLKILLESALNDVRDQGFEAKQVVLAINDNPVDGVAAREIWLM